MLLGQHFSILQNLIDSKPLNAKSDFLVKLLVLILSNRAAHIFLSLNLEFYVKLLTSGFEAPQCRMHLQLNSSNTFTGTTTEYTYLYNVLNNKVFIYEYTSIFLR